MSPSKNAKSRRKFHHQPTNIDELSALLEQASVTPSRKACHRKRMKGKSAYYDDDGERKEETRSRSDGWLKSPRSSKTFENPKSKSAPTLPSSAKEESSHISRSHPRQLAKNEEAELSLENIAFKIGSITYEMNNTGEWTTSMNSSSLKEEAQQLRSSNRKMFEENNLLRVKNELLLDMITKKTLRISRIEKDLERMRSVLTASSYRFDDDQ